MDDATELQKLQKNLQDLQKNVNAALDYATKTMKESATPQEIEEAQRVSNKYQKLMEEGKEKEAEELLNKYRNG